MLEHVRRHALAVILDAHGHAGLIRTGTTHFNAAALLHVADGIQGVAQDVQENLL